MPSSALPIPIGSSSKPFSGTETEYNTKPGFNLLRRESGFSIASLAASLPMGGGRARSTGEEETGQQLITVSRPSSLRSKTSWRIRGDGDESQDNDDESDDNDDDDDDDDDDGESAATGDEESDEGAAAEAVSVTGDARSIRSFENMLSAGKEQGKKDKKTVRPRKSISDRLASVSAVVAASKVRVIGLIFFLSGGRNGNLNLTFFLGDKRHLLLVHQDLLCSFRVLLKLPTYELLLLLLRLTLHHHHHHYRCSYDWHHRRSGLLNVPLMIFVFRK